MPKHLLEVLIYRRADGREVSLIEFSMAELLSSSERLLLVRSHVVLGPHLAYSVVLCLQQYKNGIDGRRRRVHHMRATRTTAAALTTTTVLTVHRLFWCWTTPRTSRSRRTMAHPRSSSILAPQAQCCQGSPVCDPEFPSTGNFGSVHDL